MSKQTDLGRSLQIIIDHMTTLELANVISRLNNDGYRWEAFILSKELALRINPEEETK